MPAPPLHRLLRDYLPFYTERRTIDGRLYLLDWFAGNDWAFRHGQEKTQQAYRN